MAQEESTAVKTKLFISRATGNMKLLAALAACGTTFHGSVALLYAPRKCFLALVKKAEEEWRFYESTPTAENGAEVIQERPIAIDSVFEARIFNDTAELRWLNEADGEGAAVVLCEDGARKFFNSQSEADKAIYARLEPPQTYLLWGQSAGATQNGWTRFAEARIGSFFIPVKGVADKPQRAQFTAVEYLGEYEDGNVAVSEERLTGIELVPAEEKNHG